MHVLVSYNEADAQWDQLVDELSKELYPEHRDQAIAEFTTECLQRFYLTNPDILEGPIRLLEEARNLLDAHPAAALVFANAAIETLLKAALLKPLICGLVHSESVAMLLASSLVDGVTNLDKLRKLIFGVTYKHASIDLNSCKRDGASCKVWQEIRNTQQLRNAVLHRGQFPPNCEAKTAIRVAEFVLDVIFPRVLRSVELHLHERRVCSTRGTRICSDKPLPSIPSKPPVPSETLNELRDYVRSRDGAPLYYFLRNTKLALAGGTLTVFSKEPHLTGYKERLEKYASDLYRREIAVQFAPPEMNANT